MAPWILIGAAVLVVLYVIITYNGSNILANTFGFKEHEYFETDDTSPGPVSVQL